jgi:hypothetical protein
MIPVLVCFRGSCPADIAIGMPPASAGSRPRERTEISFENRRLPATRLFKPVESFDAMFHFMFQCSIFMKHRNI